MNAVATQFPELPTPAAVLERTWRATLFVGESKLDHGIEQHAVYTADQMHQYARYYAAMLAAAPAASGGDRQADADLPGMWERADLIGGMTDAEPQPPAAASVSERAEFSTGDAVFAFSAMLTSLPHVVPFGAAAWATPGADLAAAFNEANGLSVSRDFPHGLKFPEITGRLLDTVKKAADQDDGALEQALTQQRVESVEDDMRAFGVGYMLDGRRVDPRRITVITTPQPSADAVRELVKRAYEVVHHDDECPAIGGCGDKDCRCDAVPFLRELESLLSAANDHQQNAAQGGGEK